MSLEIRLSLAFAIIVQLCFAQTQKNGLTTIIQQGHKSSLSSVAYSPDGQYIASYSSSDNNLLIWSKHGLLLKTITLTYEYAFEWTPDSQFLVGKNSIYDLEGKKVLTLSPGSNNGITCRKISPDGNLIAMGLDNTNYNGKRKIRLIDRKGNIVRIIDGTNHTAQSIAFSPDGKILAVGAGSIHQQAYIEGQQEPLDPTCEVVLMSTDGTIQKIIPVEKDVKSIIFSADGQKIVAVLSNHKVMILNADGSLVTEFTANGTNDIAYSPDNKYFILGTYSSSGPSLYDAQGKLVREFKDENNRYGAASQCRFSPDGQYIVTGNGSAIVIWDVSGRVIRTIPGFSLQLSGDLNMAPDGHYFTSGDELWSMEGKRLNLPVASNGRKFSPDARYSITREYRKNERGQTETDLTITPISGGKSSTVKGVTLEKITDKGIVTRPDNRNAKSFRLYDFKGMLVDSVKSLSLVYSADQKYYVTSDYRGMTLFESNGKKIQYFPQADSSFVKGKNQAPVFFSPDGQVLLQHVKNGVNLYSVPSGNLLSEISAVTHLNGGYEINDGAYGNGIMPEQSKKIFFSKDSKKLYILGYYTLKVFDLSGNRLLEGPKFTEMKGTYPNVAVSNDDKFLIAYSSGPNKLHRVSLESGSIIASTRILDNNVEQLFFTPDGKFLLTKDINGSERLWNAETLEEVAAFYGLGDADYAIVTPDGYYAASKNAGRYMHFSKGIKAFTFDNFDLIYNRPDIIAKRLGYASNEMIDGLKNAYLKRLKKMGFTEDQVGLDVHLPEIQILTKNIQPVTNSKVLITSVKVLDSKYQLDRINVYVNEVPLFGSKGMSVKDLKVTELTKDIKVELVNGRNLIQFAVMNDKGAESIKESIDILYNGPVVKPVLYAVAIGVSDYADNTFDLKYAAKDANDLAALLSTNKGGYAEVKLLKITDASATKENIRRAKDFLKPSRVDDEVILFVAGHGLLDSDMNFYFATANVNFNDPGVAGLPYEDLEGLLDGIPARKKLMLIDACHSGEVDKDETVVATAVTKTTAGSVASRGFKPVARKESMGLKNSFELMQELFTDLRRGSGAIVISSASGVEFAFESDVWKNGVFTYSLLEGLKTGNANLIKDGEIKVSELRDYVIKRVGELTNGKQTPTSRKESLEFDFKIW